MAKWIVSVSWECEVEAADDASAVLEASNAFSFVQDARAERAQEAAMSASKCGICGGYLAMHDDAQTKQCRDK
jgi:hypothetical protein